MKLSAIGIKWRGLSTPNSAHDLGHSRILSGSSDTFSVAFTRSPLALTITALDDGQLVAVNDAFVRISGYTREEAIGRTPDELKLWADPDRREARFARLIAGKPVPDVEARFRLKNGEIRIGLIGSAIVDIDGRKCVLSSVLDITDRKIAEDRARESEARYRAILESQVEMLCRFRPDGEILFANAAYARARGTTPEHLMTQNFWAFVDEADRDPVRAQLQNMSPEKPEVAIENRFETIEGIRWTLWTNRALTFDDAGRPTEVQSSGIDITDRRHAEQRLRESEAQLRRAGEIKDEFLATLSHELRTPLNAVLGWVHMLRAGTLPPETTARALEVLERNARAQSQLVEDLLDMSRIISGKLTIRDELVTLNAVAADAEETVRPAAMNKGVNLEVELPPQPVIQVRGDPDRLRQALWNLLSNAIKFTPPGGTVGMQIFRDGAAAIITVRDTGEGIEPAFLPVAFERFRQADSSTTRRHSGLGLGLAITRHLVEAHGGAVSAHSDGVDHGSTFTVRLPLADPRSAEAPSEL